MLAFLSTCAAILSAASDFHFVLRSSRCPSAPNCCKEWGLSAEFSLGLHWSYPHSVWVSICRIFFPCAGKVHGSLSRAGKVRAQTPKVEKQEKPKKPKGRAGQRLKFNRYVVEEAFRSVVGEALGSVVGEALGSVVGEAPRSVADDSEWDCGGRLPWLALKGIPASP